MASPAGNPSPLERLGLPSGLPVRVPGRIVDRVTGASSPRGSVSAMARRPVVSLRWALQGLRNLLRALPAGLVAALIGFHAWLLYDGISTGRILDLDVAARWAAGLALTGVLVVFWRLGVPLLRGRKAVVLWALVVVLHAHAMATRPVALGAETPATQVLVSLAVQLGGPLATAFGLILLAIGARPAAASFRRRLVLVLTSDTLAHARSGGISLAAPRPPPVLA